MNGLNQLAVFAGGCFWCTEAIYQNLKGVINVKPGYAGGHAPNPTYEQVMVGRTGHAESVEVEFDPSQISYKDLLEVFFATHDPTTLNRQDYDIGEEYRSMILYKNEEQKNEAEKFIEALRKEQIYSSPIVTEIKPLDKFHQAEDYHKNYYERNKNKPYCQIIINPKLEKLRRKFTRLLKH